MWEYPLGKAPLCPAKGDIINNLKRYKRKSIRLKQYNYKKEGMYFITICVKNRKCILGEIIEKEMHLNEIGKNIEKALLNIPIKFKKFDINLYQIMPDHIHFILEIKEKMKLK